MAKMKERCNWLTEIYLVIITVLCMDCTKHNLKLQSISHMRTARSSF